MESGDLQELYQEIILDHNKRPRNFHLMDPCTHDAHGNNPLCGDEIHVYLQVEDGVISDVSFSGEGCAISKASASLMTLAVKGKTLADVRERAESVFAMFTGSDADPSELLMEQGDIAALSGVKKFPARIKCATLSWHALVAALEGEASITTE